MSVLKFTQEELDEMQDEKPNISVEIEEDEKESGGELSDIEEEEREEDTREPPEEIKKDEVFNVPKTQPDPDYDEEPAVKTKKKRKPLSEETKAKLRASLAKAREKSKEKRKAQKELRIKKEALAKAERKKHIRARKAKKMNEDAELEVEAESFIHKKENEMWNEERITNLMNRTLDTYFTKRQEEKTKRQSFPAPPQGYYIPSQPAHMQQPQRAIPKPAPKPKPKAPSNPYANLWGLTQEDFDEFASKNNNTY